MSARESSTRYVTSQICVVLSDSLIYSQPHKFALSRLPRSKSAALYAAYTKFEKQHGTRTTLESTVLGKRRIQYEEELQHDGRNYDVWFDYARLEEGALRELREEGATSEEEERATNRVREVYERAVAQVPPGGEKRHWRRYIFLWLFYALFEETETKVRGTRCAYRCLRSEVVNTSLHANRTMNAPGRSMRPRFGSFHTSNSPLRSCGLRSRGSRFGSCS